MADTNPYDALIQTDTAGALRSTMAQVVDRNPDAEARLQQLARTHNMPVDAVRLRLPEIERHDKLAALDYDTLAQQYPKTATTLADPARAGVAHDEVDGMSTLERVARQFSGGALEAGGMMLRGFGIGTDLAQRNILGAITELLPTPRGGAMTPEAKQTAIGPLLGEDFRRVGGDVKGYARSSLMLPGGQQTYVDQVVAGVGQVGGQIVAMPLVGPAGLYLQGLDAMDEKVGGDNAPQWKKDLATVGGAAITGITEKWALDKLLGPAGDAVRNQFTGALARIGIAGASEGAQEFSENMLQDLLRMGLTNSAATPDLVQSIQEGGVGAGVGVVVRGMVEGMLHVRSRGARAEHQAQQAEAHAQVLGELSTLAEASKLRERDPAVFASFMQSLTDEGVPNVYVDAKTLQTLDLQAVAQVLPSVAEQIEQAANTGGDVVIPTAELLTAGSGSDFMQTLLDNVRTSPEAMSTAEARTYMQTKGDQLAADIDKVLSQQEQNHERQQMRDQLRDEFKAQLDGVRRFTQDVNLQYANLLANFYSVTADKLGVTPQELASRYALKVQAKGVEGGQVLDQVRAHEWADRETAPIGAWVKADYKLADSQPVYQVREVEPSELYLPELDAEGRLQPEKRKYLQGYVDRAKAGEVPPSISVIEMEDGRLRVVDGHRRALAAMAAGKKIRALVSPLVGTPDGKQEATAENIGHLNQSAKSLPPTIEIDGKQRPTVNSKGQAIASTEEGVQNFWKWFGESKVVDAEGRPLVVYHGTRGDFTEFQPSKKFGEMYFASESQSYANALARSVFGDSAGGNVMPLFFSLQNPAVVPFESYSADDLDVAWNDNADGLIAVDAAGVKQVVVVFNPTQIKSAIGNSGEFDPANPSILMQSGNERDLMVTHNLSAANLLHADKMGGLPVPSLAITKKDTPLTGFGEITLIGPPEMADPKGYASTKVFGADIYSPRYPSVERELDTKAWGVFRKKFEPMAEEMGVSLPDRDDVERRGVEQLETNIAVMGQFLRDQGIAPEIVMRKGMDDARRARLEGFGLTPWMNNTSAFAMLEDPEFVRLAAEEAASAYRDSGDERMIARADKMVSDPVTSKNLARDLAHRIANDAKLRAKPEADKYETQKALNEQIEAADLSAAFSSFVSDQIDGVTKSERIPQGYTTAGKRKYVPHTLENVVKILKKELRGGESFNYGVGSVRAKFTPQFKSVAQIKKEKGRLISAEQFDAIKGEINAEFVNMAEAMKIRTETLSAIMEDGATQGLARAAKTYDVDLDDGRAEQIAEFMDKLRNLPTAYFEAKILRDVSLSEFKAAVVPEDVDPKALDALRKAGITDIRTYAKGDEADRGAKIGGFQDLFFQQARGSINLPDNLTESPSIVSLFEGADLSTFIHESGHFFLEVQIDLAARIQGQINDGMAVSEGERQIVQDARTLLAWMGMPGGDTDPLTEWHSLDIEAKRPMHEQFARGFEAYAFEGRAPSVELQSTFQKFRAWMLAVYKELKALRVTLTDDVRQVMDRMLASEQAIEEAEAARRMGPLFKTAEEAGMTLDEFKAYHALANDASQVALEELQARGLRDMRWLENARTGKLKEMQDLHASLRREVRAEVRRDVMSQPVYRAWQFLTAKEERADTATPADKPKASRALDPTRDSLFTAVAKLGGLDKAEAISLWGLDPKEKLDSGVFGAPVLRAKDGLSVDALGERLLEAGYLTPDESGRYDPQELEEKFDAERRGESIYSFWFNYGEEAPDTIPEHALAGKLDMPEIVARYGADKAATLQARKMTSKSRGIDADVIAEHVGFDSGDAMVQALLDAEAPQSVIEGMTDQRMLERYGDLGTPEGLQRAADRAIHNDVRARFLASEIKALERGMQVRKETGGVNAKGQRVTVDVMAQVARQQAERIVGATKVKNLKPSQYTAAEARAARAAERAMLEGKTDEALAEKRHQLINAQAAKAALRAQDEIEKTVAYLRKFNDKPKGLDVDYHDQIVQLLERFDLARGTTLREIDKRKSLQEWLESQRAQGLEPDIPPELLREAQRVSYKDTTVDELRGLRDTVRQIERLGRLKNQLLTAKQLRDFQAVRDLIADSIDANAGDRQADTRTPQAGTFAAWFQKVRNFGAAHIKAASWARIFDGGKDGGPVWEYFIRPANEAANMETRMRAEATEKLTALLAPVLNAGKLHGKGQHFPSIGRSMNREQVLALALNMGNEGNIQRMLDGENWTVGQIQPVLASLSAADWQTVQAVWDHFESYRPLIAAKERRIYGKEPAWVEPMPLVVQTSEGTSLTLRGGYYPIKFDPLANNRAEQHADAEDAKRQMQAAYTSATTRRGFTKARAEAVKNRPLLYSLSAVYSGTNDVIHDLAFHEWLIDVNKLLRADKINDAIRQAYGPAAVRQLKTWIEDTARGDSATQAELDSTLGRLRHGISVAGLGFNVVSAMMQPLGLTQSIVRIGAPWVGKGVLQYVAGPVAAARRVNEMSDFMAGRTRTRFRELNELRNQVEGETRAQELVGRYAYFLMMRVQQAVDVPTWLGAYEKALADGQPDERAVALADQAVIDAQGGGQTKDLSAIERGGPAQKLFTVFYSFMNTALNLGVTQGMTEKSRAKLAADMLLLYTVPVVLGAALKDALVPGDSGEWDDWEKIVKRLLAEQVGFLMGLMVVTREFGDAAKSAMGLVDHARDYSGPAGTRLIADTYGLAKQVSQGEFDDAFRKSLVNVTGDLFGLPSAQVNRSITGVQALMEGETSNPAAAVFGYQEP